MKRQATTTLSDDITSKKSKKNVELKIHVTPQQDVQTLKSQLEEIEQAALRVREIIQCKEKLCASCSTPLTDETNTIKCSYSYYNGFNCPLNHNMHDNNNGLTTKYCDKCAKKGVFQCNFCHLYYCVSHHFKKKNLDIQGGLKTACMSCYMISLSYDIRKYACPYTLNPLGTGHAKLYEIITSDRDLVEILHKRIGLTANMLHHILNTQNNSQIDRGLGCNRGWKIVQNDVEIINNK